MHDTDALVIGAGPVGLFQVFQLGLLGLTVHAVDALPQPGGQCAALYPQKPIYDVPGVPVCTGLELADQLLKQASPFTGTRHEHLHLGELVEIVEPLPGEQTGYRVITHSGLTFHTKVLIITAGAGAFVPRSMKIAGLDEGPHLHYYLPEESGAAAPWVHQHVVVAGGGDEALSAALALAAQLGTATGPSRVSLMHRRDQFQAEPELETAVRAQIQAGAIQWIQGMPDHACVIDGRLTELHVLGSDGSVLAHAVDHVLVRQGLSPKLGPLSNWGLTLERKQIPVDVSTFQTALPGIYAAGDINTYPGKKRLLVCGFHEATMAAYAAREWLRPDEPHHLQYTTTSTLLKQRLGVA